MTVNSISPVNGIVVGMASPQPSIERLASPKLFELDPWHWTVDQVVFALTDPSSAFLSSNPTLTLPGADILARTLREQDVNGLALLTGVNYTLIRDEWEIKSMSHRASIIHLVKKIQESSAKFREEYPDSGRVSSVGIGSRMGTPFIGSPNAFDPRESSRTPRSWHSPIPSYHPSLTHPSIDNVLAQGVEQAPGPWQDTFAGDTHRKTLEPQDQALHGGADTVVSSTSKANDCGLCELPVRVELDIERDEGSSGAEFPTETVLKKSEQQVQQVETTIIDESGRKRRRLILGPNNSPDDPQYNEAEAITPDLNHSSSNTLGGLSQDDGIFMDAENLLAFKEPILEGGSQASDFQKVVLLSSTRKGTSTMQEQAPQAGILSIDEHGKKRMRPILISPHELGSAAISEVRKSRGEHDAVDALKHIEEPQISTLVKTQQFGRRADRRTDQIYLGPAPLTVDDLFYGDIPFDAEITQELSAGDSATETNELSMIPQAGSNSGLSIYVNSRIKYFLRSALLQLKQDGRGCVGRVPYPDRIGKKHHALSMTIFSKKSNQVSALRSNRSSWIKDESSRSENVQTGEKPNVFNVADPAFAQNDGDDPEWRALEKWKHIGEDSVLPLYGESGSEGEYELDTWREMEQEKGELARPLKPSKTRKLTAQAVQEAIDESIKQITQDWAVKKEPKLKLTAWRLWARSRRDNNARLQIKNLNQEIMKLDDRIANIRKEIAAEEWSQINHISKQCKIMQPSVFDREDKKWKMATLNLRKIPEKPPRKIPKIKSVKSNLLEETLNENEENLMTSASTSEVSDDSLDDFIVEDEVNSLEYQPVVVDEDLTMADVEDAIDSDTLDDTTRGATNTVDSVNSKSELQTGIQRKLIVKNPPNSSPQQDFVDLTLDSDHAEQEVLAPKTEPSYDIKTPPLFSEDDSDVFERSRKRKAVFQKPPSPKTTTVINLESESAYSTAAESPLNHKKSFPALDDVDAIGTMNPSDLVERQDRKRLLIWVLAHTLHSRRAAVSKYLAQYSLEKCFQDTTKGLRDLLAYKRRIQGLDRETSDSILSIASWNVCWTIPVKIDPNGLQTDHIQTTLAERDGFEAFYDFLLECLGHYKTNPTPLVLVTPKKISGVLVTPQKKKQNISRDESDEALQETPFRKRKYAVTESQQTLDQRQNAQDRMRADEERRRLRELEFRFVNMGSNIEGSTEVIINPGKREDQELIHLNPKFGNGAQIKPHQVKGLQFIWREITAEQDLVEDLQGCLLAQDMGLGKTMQVIALLVTIAEASKSSSNNIRQQIPKTLRVSRTLVLCPPALLENWWDEFLIWVPQPFKDSIGDVRKVSASMKLDARLDDIQAWSAKGGVLLLGYDTFSALVHNKPKAGNKAKKSRPPQLDEIQHAMVKEALLKRANLVVADEAHKFKGRKTKINEAVNWITTKSRIALTGSPLNNNLEEYYTMIDWIAPNYLGQYFEFKATYEEPIRDGLHPKASARQYRESRKRLKALEMEMEPKVHRANVSVLRADLPGKTEFVVIVPLTQLQERLYSILVQAMPLASTNGGLNLTSLWSWIAVLQLLCNHPKCFRDKMLASQTAMTGSAKTKTPNPKKQTNVRIADDGGSEEDILLLTEPASKSILSQTNTECEEVFQDLTVPLDDLSFSNKMQLLMNILEFSFEAQDKVLVFSHRIATLDYVGDHLEKIGKTYARIDGITPPQRRQQITKNFNEGSVIVCLISTRAGGTGLNMFGANRVVIMDENWNPTWEQQAIGRAYRIGQVKPVYVYRLTTGGTFEQDIQNQGLFKEQLANRVVDQQNANPSALKEPGEYLYLPRLVKQEDLTSSLGKDTKVLDRLLANPSLHQIASIVPSESFHIEDGIILSPDDLKEAEQIKAKEQIRRRNPQAHHEMNQKRIQAVQEHTRSHPPTSGITGHGPPGTQIPQHQAYFSSKTAMTMPPSTAPSLPMNMGGLPDPYAPKVGLARPIINDPSESRTPVARGPEKLSALALQANSPSMDLALPGNGAQRISSSDRIFRPPGPEPVTSESVGRDREKEDAVLTAVDDLFRSKHGRSSNPLDSETIPLGAQKAAQMQFSTAMLKHNLDSNGVAIPLGARPMHADNLVKLILEQSVGETEFEYFVSGIRQLLERDNVDPDVLLKVMSTKLQRTPIVPLSSLDHDKPAPSSDKNKNTSIGPSSPINVESNGRKPPGGMLSSLGPSHVDESNSNMNDRSVARHKSKDGATRKHSLPAEGVDGSRKRQMPAITPGLPSSKSIESQFDEFLSREASRSSTL